MMASIPNMRSTPLPLSSAKTAPGGESAPGDFAAQMPAVPGSLVEAAALLPEAIVDPAALVPEADATGEGGEKADSPETKATETPRPGQPDPALVVIPFLPAQPAVQVPATVSAGETIPAQPKEAKLTAPADRPFRPAGEPGTAKPGLPLPAVARAPKEQADAPKDQTDAAAIEAAVKELLGRKQAATKPAAPGGRHADAAKPDAAPAQAPAQPQTQSAAPVAVQVPPAPAPVVPQAPDQSQPGLALPAPQPAPLKAEAADTAPGTRTTDLAVERQLDLARDAQWLDRLARDIARAGSDDQPLRFRLHPQTLGHLQVELQQGDHGTAVRLTVETEAARQILADAQPRLAAEARAQGVRIAETHVDLSGSGRHAPGDQRRQDETRQTPLIRTARGSGTDAVASPRSSARARLDRYA